METDDMTTAKLRSLVLAAVIVASVVAMTGPFADTARATETVGNTAVLNGPNYYGQEFRIDVTSSTGSEFTATSGESVFLLEVDDASDTVNRTVDDITVDSNGDIQFDTERFETDNRRSYALNDDNELNDGAVNFTLEPQTLDLAWEDDTVATDDESVVLETVESNRGAGDYNVTISANGFDYEQLQALFVHPGTDLQEVTDTDHLPLEELGFDPDQDDVTDLRADGYITLDLSTSTNFTDDEEIVANFSNLDEQERVPDDGSYEFETIVTDSTAEDTASVRIGGAETAFDEPLYTRAAGDVVAFTVELDATDEVWVQMRDTGSAFVDVLYLEDDNSDGEVTVYANTRLMGTDHSDLSGVSDGDGEIVYEAREDTVQSYIHDKTIPGNSGAAVADARFYDGETTDASEISFPTYVDSITGDTPTTQIERPLQPTSYELVADRRGQFVIEGDGETPAVANQIGESEMDLVQPSVRELETFVAPAARANSERSVSGLEAAGTDRDTVAVGDRLVLRYNATGVVGALAAIDYAENGNSIDEGLSDGYGADVFYELAVTHDGTDWEGEGVTFSLEGPDQTNAEPETLSLDSGNDRDAYLLVDQQRAERDPGNVYVVVDSGADAFEDDIGDENDYTAELVYEASGKRFQFTDADGPAGGAGGDVTEPVFPYYGETFRENVTESGPVSFEELSVTFDSRAEETVELAPSSNAVVSGRTNLAPGTNATVGVRVSPRNDTLPDEDPSFIAEQGVTVDKDGTFDATLDLGSRRVGEEGTVRLTRDDTALASSPAVFRDIESIESAYFEVELDTPESAETGETVPINVTVTNVGRENGTADVTISVDGSDRVRGVFDLQQGESRQLSHSVEMGEQDIDVGVRSQDTDAAARVNYDDGVTPTPTPAETTTDTPTPVQNQQTAAPPPEPADSGGSNLPLILGSVAAVGLLAAASALALRWY